MARFFIGSATHKMDAKGRVSLPSDYRAVLEAHGGRDRFVLVPASDGFECHIAFTVAGHERLVEALSVGEEAFASPEEERETRRRYIWSAKPLQLESTGRFVLSQELRSAIGLTSEVHFVGDGQTFQIWDPARFGVQAAPADAPAKPKALNLARLT